MKLTNDEKNMIKGFVVFFLYILFSIFTYVPFKLIGVDINNVPVILRCTYIIICELIIIVIGIFLFKDYYKKALNDFKKNKDKYFKKYIKYWFLILFCTAFMNLIISIFSNGIAGNEEQVRALLNSHTLYTWITGVILAPVIEELVFRLSINQIFKKKWLFILISGFVFGSFHIIGNVNSWVDILYILPYSFPGCVFAWILYDSKNIFNTMWMHFMHNGLLLALQLLLIIFNIKY